MKFKSPVHSYTFDDIEQYRYLLTSYMDELRTVHRGVQNLGKKWPAIRQNIAQFKRLRDELQSQTDMQSIESFLCYNRHAVSNAPGLAMTSEMAIAHDIRFFNVEWMSELGFQEITMPIPEMETNIVGSGWIVELEIVAPKSSSPRFSMQYMAQSLSCYGLYITRYSFKDRDTAGFPHYQCTAMMPAKIWHNLAMFEKLSGNIEGPVDLSFLNL